MNVDNLILALKKVLEEDGNMPVMAFDSTGNESDVTTLVNAGSYILVSGDNI